MLPQLKLIGHSLHSENRKCKSGKNWGSLVNSRWMLDESIKFKYNNSIDCKYRNITRKDDFSLEYSDFKKIYNMEIVNSELIEIICNAKTDNYKMIYYQIIPKTIKSFKINKCKPLNLLLLSYDSVSRVSWHMRLNKTTNYMFKTMNFQQMNAMNIIGIEFNNYT